MTAMMIGDLNASNEYRENSYFSPEICCLKQGAVASTFIVHLHLMNLGTARRAQTAIFGRCISATAE